MNFKKLAIVLAISVMGLSTAACGAQVPAGYVGVKVKNYGGGAGVQPDPLPTRFHFTGWGEEIHLYPVTQKTYKYEKLQFTDHTGLQLNGDVAITLRVASGAAPALYNKYRLDVDELIDGPIRIATRAAVRQIASDYTSEQIYSGKEAEVLARATSILQERYGKEGIEIIQLDWVGNVNYPQTVLDAITSKTEKLQLAEAAKADEARAIAQGNAQIAAAKAEAESTRIRAQALQSNPQILEQMWIEKWSGNVPSTVVMGSNSGTTLMISPPKH